MSHCATIIRIAIAAGLLLTSWPLLASDDYLAILNAEVKKLEARRINGAQGTNEVVQAAELDQDAEQSEWSRDDFELALKRRYVGTYGFYQRLAEANRQAVFQHFQAGMPMDEVRRNIIARLLHR